MKTLYVDASTINNGQKGEQKTTILVSDDAGNVLLRKEIGDYTNNEGEVRAILEALKIGSGSKRVLSDSKISVNWINKGFGRKSKASLITYEWVEEIEMLLERTNSKVSWVGREENLAGRIFEFGEATKKENKEDFNTHNLIVDFGKHKGERWTRIPVGYLKWLINQPEVIPGMEKNKDLAQSELNRRGTVLSTDVEISKHAIDTASLRVRKIWHENRGEDEGLYSWLVRIANEAVSSRDDKPEKIAYLGMNLIFKWGNVHPILKTVMLKKRRK